MINDGWLDEMHFESCGRELWAVGPVGKIARVVGVLQKQRFTVRTCAADADFQDGDDLLLVPGEDADMILVAERHEVQEAMREAVAAFTLRPVP